MPEISSPEAAFEASAASPVPPRRQAPFAVVAAAAAVVITVTLGVMLWILIATHDGLVARDRETQMQLVAGSIGSTLDQASRFALALAETAARRSSVADALATGDRDALIRLSEGPWTYLNKQAGVQIYGFHDKTLHYLLRMHKRETWGDDISGFRAMVVASNRFKRPQSGLELGIGGIGVRGVAPIVRDGELLGTTEAGLDVKPLLESVKSTTNADVAVLVAPALAAVAIDPKWRTLGEFAIAASTDDALFAALLANEHYVPNREVVYSSVRFGGRGYSAVFLPLVDFAGRQIGTTVALRETPETDRRRVGTALWVVALCGGVAAFVTFVVLLRVCGSRREEA